MTTRQAKSAPQRRPASRLGRGLSLSKIRALVERQARSWERNDFDLGAGDWLPDATLEAPDGKWRPDEIRQAMADYYAEYADVQVDIKNVFAASDGRQLAIEWDWTVTRKSDGLRTTTHDAHIVDLVRGKIKSWREYYDRWGTVEAPSQPSAPPAG